MALTPRETTHHAEAPKAEGPKQEAPPPPVGKTTVSTAVDVLLTVTEPVSGVRVSLDDLGVAEGPTSVAETGNNAALDKDRPPVIDGSDLLVFFKPALGSGKASFRFTFTWEKDIEPVVPKPLVDGKYDGVVEGKGKK